MDLLELRDKVSHDLRTQVMSSKILCRHVRLLDEASRRSSAFADGTYIPFYYYLGKYVSPKSVFRYGFGLGLFLRSFLQGCHTVERLFAFRPATDMQEAVSCKIGGKNVRDVYKNPLEIYAGPFSDQHVQKSLSAGWDMVMVDAEVGYDDFRYLLDVLWRHVSPAGFLVVDRAGEDGAGAEPFHDFCKINRLDPLVFDTRYGTGLVRKET